MCHKVLMVFACSLAQEVTEELKNYQSVIEALHEQAASLGEQVCVRACESVIDGLCYMCMM